MADPEDSTSKPIARRQRGGTAESDGGLNFVAEIEALTRLWVARRCQAAPRPALRVIEGGRARGAAE
ncbi:hypothetical protein [Rhodovastum atsumiense]|uniref:Uncharacterized protein n=1 Tax=Rhodovastum atsumiense TaxID=504468 RepID=A0A5M6IIG8_9PROT|nr:hypothetical protein [Rhodovastum atsumiense]KAA5608076.1 hypothetical protein F1189_30765 [Rhodovastum atsumiense]